MRYSIITDQVDEDLERALAKIQSEGLCEVELHNVFGKTIEQCDDEEVERIRTLLKQYGMRVSSIASTIFFLCPLYEGDQVSLFNPSFYTIEGDADAHLEYARRACRIAKALGAPVVRAFPFRAPDNRKGPYGTDEDFERIVAQMRRLAAIAEEERVVIAIENCPYSHLPKGEMTLKLWKAVQSDWIRLLWDPANSFRAEIKQVPGQYQSWTLEEEAKRLLPMIAHIHIKDYSIDVSQAKPFVHEVLGQGDIDFPAVLRVLKEGGYTGALSLEPEVDAEGAIECIRQLKAMT
ncbi:sugar phosphate isomerase/epimerase family protein [uncultured Dubosiella sp.]|uniref:sugar phosphate isomerase/epimerase family protein n=1 Tax=uncultured Dubosiella sp. TaxID=1937011 RepID=UPI00258BCFCB|nr:sugar phosphate isomerase/epimerase family protein [uncultured Dubosiella sp.]